MSFKRIARTWRWRLPLLFPPPVPTRSATNEFGVQLFCAWVLRLAEVLLIARGRYTSAGRLRMAFDLTVNIYAIGLKGKSRL